MIKIDDIRVILYNKSEMSNKLTERFLSLKNISYEKYTDDKNFNEIIQQLKNKKYSSKEVLILKEFKGRMFQKCPGSKNVICCNYLLLNTCFDCLYDCTYCFLNSYLNSFGIVQFTNVYSVVDEIDDFIKDAVKDNIYRIGTGEFTDSLMMDEITGIAEHIIQNTYLYKNLIVEFKTKSDNIDHLLLIKEKGNAVLAWSLNTERNIKEYEKGAARLENRLDSAKRAVESGYYTAFHFDPIIYNEFIDEYAGVIDKLFDMVDPGRIVWISMGCFRYGPGFKNIIRDKYPEELLTVEEMFPGPDGKYRYLKQKRIGIYRKLLDKIRSYSHKPFVYLCMETPDVWESVYGFRFNSSDDLEEEFNRHLKDNFISFSNFTKK